MSNRQPKGWEHAQRIEAEKAATRKKKGARPDKPTKPPEGPAPTPPPGGKRAPINRTAIAPGGYCPCCETVAERDYVSHKEGCPVLSDAVGDLFREMVDLLTEIRDALVPSEQETCEKCGSTHIQKEHHDAEHPCGAGACLRAGADGGEHLLYQCGDCGHAWVEAVE